MTQVGETVKMALLLPENAASANQHACRWRCTLDQKGEHPKKWHSKPVTYPEGGQAERSDGYSNRWKTAGRVPWTERQGIDPRRWPDAYHLARHSAATSYAHPRYATEGHHLISCDIFTEADYPALVFNALLMGYDINGDENGWHFPAHIVDIVCHNLQHHASQHNWSEPAPLKYDLDELVAPLLANLEQQILPYCEGDYNGELQGQRKIVSLLNKLSERIRRKLVRWDWYLTKLARMRLGDIRRYGIQASHVQAEGEGFVVVYEKKAAVRMIESNLSLGGFPHFQHYVAAAVKELDGGMNPNVPFSWWLSRRMYRERMGREPGPNSPAARAGAPA